MQQLVEMSTLQAFDTCYCKVNFDIRPMQGRCVLDACANIRSWSTLCSTTNFNRGLTDLVSIAKEDRVIIDRSTR